MKNIYKKMQNMQDAVTKGVILKPDPEKRLKNLKMGYKFEKIASNVNDNMAKVDVPKNSSIATVLKSAYIENLKNKKANYKELKPVFIPTLSETKQLKTVVIPTTEVKGPLIIPESLKLLKKTSTAKGSAPAMMSALKKISATKGSAPAMTPEMMSDLKKTDNILMSELSVNNESKPLTWLEHVKKCRSKNPNLSYKEALKFCKDSYIKKEKPKKEKKEKIVKEKIVKEKVVKPKKEKVVKVRKSSILPSPEELKKKWDNFIAKTPNTSILGEMARKNGFIVDPEKKKSRAYLIKGLQDLKVPYDKFKFSQAYWPSFKFKEDEPYVPPEKPLFSDLNFYKNMDFNV